MEPVKNREETEQKDAATLKAEALAFARYVVGRDAPEEMLERYVEANRALLPEAPSSAERAVVEFARAHKWAICLFDAACGWRRPNALVRTKIYIMAAILEASPHFVDEFAPRAVSPLALGFLLPYWGALAGIKAVLGIALMALVERTRS